MDIKKFLLGTVVGGVADFLFGFVIYGVLLADTMMSYNNPTCARSMAQFVWWSLILANLFYASILTYVFLKSNVKSFAAGAQTGMIVTLLMTASMDLMSFAMTTMMNDATGIVIDVIASSVLGALVGGVIGTVLGMGNKPATA